MAIDEVNIRDYTNMNNLLNSITSQWSMALDESSDLSDGHWLPFSSFTFFTSAIKHIGIFDHIYSKD